MTGLYIGDQVRSRSRHWQGEVGVVRLVYWNDTRAIVLWGQDEFYWAADDLEVVLCGYCGGSGWVMRLPHDQADCYINIPCPRCQGKPMGGAA